VQFVGILLICLWLGQTQSSECIVVLWHKYDVCCTQLLKVDEDHRLPHVEMACKQIVDCLVQTSLNAANGQDRLLVLCVCVCVDISNI